MDRSRSAACRGCPRWRSLSAAGLSSAPPAPPDRRRTREVAGVRERRHHHDVAGVDLTIGDGVIKVDRDTGTEQIAAVVKGIAVTFLGNLERFTPVAQEHPVGLIGDQQAEVLGRQPVSLANRERHFGHLPIAASEYLADFGFGEPDGGLTGTGLPPLAGWVDCERHVAGVFAVGAALDVEYGRLVRQRDQTDRGPVAGYGRLRLLAHPRLVV